MANPNDILIDGSTATWDMGHINGRISGTYTGTFKFRCFLTPTQSLAAARDYRELLGPQLPMAPEHEKQLSFALTQLKYRVLKSPPFWTAPNADGEIAGNIPDLNVILAVLDAAITAEDKYTTLRATENGELLKSAISASEEDLAEDEEDENE